MLCSILRILLRQWANVHRIRSIHFPYLYDESQSVAKTYGAECTPDIFLYDENLRLAYRGRFDESRPGIGQATGEEFLQAVDELLTLGVVTMPQRPSMGCNIKWK